MSTTRTARFVQNTLSTALYQLTAMVMGFITPRLMILYYGSEINGLIVSVTEFLTYFKMLEAGLAASVNVALYEPLARRDHQAVSGIASAARLFYNAAGWMFTGLTVAFTIAYPFFVPVRDLNGLPRKPPERDGAHFGHGPVGHAGVFHHGALPRAHRRRPAYLCGFGSLR